MWERPQGVPTGYKTGWRGPL